MSIDNAQRFQVFVTLLDGKIEKFVDVLQLGPVQSQPLFLLVLLSGEQIVYPFTSIKKYTFKLMERSN
jgi:hypothetical protein